MYSWSRSGQIQGKLGVECVEAIAIQNCLMFSKEMQFFEDFGEK